MHIDIGRRRKNHIDRAGLDRQRACVRVVHGNRLIRLGQAPDYLIKAPPHRMDSVRVQIFAVEVTKNHESRRQNLLRAR